MSYLMLVINIAHRVLHQRRGGQRQQCHGWSRGRCHYGQMGAGAQKLWNDNNYCWGHCRARQKNTRPKFKMHQNLKKDSNENIISR
jgi:hypothetical protein